VRPPGLAYIYIYIYLFIYLSETLSHSPHGSWWWRQSSSPKRQFLTQIWCSHDDFIAFIWSQCSERTVKNWNRTCFLTSRSCRWGDTMSLNWGYQRDYCSSSRWYVSMESQGEMILTGGNQWTRRKTCQNATLSIKNPTLTDSGTNAGLCYEGPGTYCLTYGMADRFLTYCQEFYEYLCIYNYNPVLYIYVTH
jgi:hypothetical protein